MTKLGQKETNAFLMIFKKVQTAMAEVSKSIGYEYSAPEPVFKSEGATMEDLEKELNGLAEDVESLSKAVRDYTAVNSQPVESDTVPAEVEKAIEDLVTSIPKKEDIEKMVKEAVKSALQTTFVAT